MPKQKPNTTKIINQKIVASALMLAGILLLLFAAQTRAETSQNSYSDDGYQLLNQRLVITSDSENDSVSRSEEFTLEKQYLN